MRIRTVKYNPAFLSEEDLVRSFVVRHTDLELIVQVLRENVTDSNQHVLVTGPRGIGKTMLALRVAAEVRRTEELRRRWYPLVFAEETYQVSTPGEFWLEALFHLAEQTNDSRWKRTYETLRDDRDEQRLRESALAQLMDFADAEGKRLLFVVENFGMLLGDQISDDDGWALRHALLHEPRIMLLATAASRFDEIQSQGKPMFELFKPHRLHPLTEDECREVWISITETEPTDGRIRPIQILTGGNPRLVTIISSFGARLSFKELLTDLMHLVDEHTEYFKSHLDNLAPTERKVYLGLADLWRPATAREVAGMVRLGVSKTSAFLRRLEDRGAVIVRDQAGRTKSYQVAERMYNVYYLMRRRAGGSGRVRALVNFIVGFYPPQELINVTARIAEEACALEPERSRDHYLAVVGIMTDPAVQTVRQKILSAIPQCFFEGEEIPSSIRDVTKHEEWEHLKPKLCEFLEDLSGLAEQPDGLAEAKRIFLEAIELSPKNSMLRLALAYLHEISGEYESAEKVYGEAIELDTDFVILRFCHGQLLHLYLERYHEAEVAYRKALDLAPEMAEGWAQLGELLGESLQRYEDAETAYRKAIELDPECRWAWGGLGRLLHERLQRYEEAEAAYRTAIELDEQDGSAWTRLGQLLDERLQRYDTAETAYRKAIELDADNGRAWGLLGQLLHEHLDRYDEAEVAYRKAIESLPECASWAWTQIGDLRRDPLGRYAEAEEAYRNAIGLDEGCAPAWSGLGALLWAYHHRRDEAEYALRRALELAPDNPLDRVLLLTVLLDGADRLAEALKLAEDVLFQYNRDPWVLGLLALLVTKRGGAASLTRCEAWAREAVTKAPEQARHQGTLASVLCASGKWGEALEPARKVVEDASFVKDTVDHTVELFVSLGAGGYCQEALEILQDSPSAELLEPLIVGLRLFLGEKVNVAVEILEVGKDVVKRIQERQMKLSTERLTENQPAEE